MGIRKKFHIKKPHKPKLHLKRKAKKTGKSISHQGKVATAKAKKFTTGAAKTVNKKVVRPIGKELSELEDFSKDQINRVTGAVEGIGKTLSNPVVIIAIAGGVIVLFMATNKR